MFQLFIESTWASFDIFLKIQLSLATIYMQNDIHAKNKYIFDLVFKRLLFYFWRSLLAQFLLLTILFNLTTPNKLGRIVI